MKPASSLASSLERRLNGYALAASAAGVGMLALAQTAEAKIIYTPTHVKVTNGLGLDLNNDGINDFSFATSTTLANGFSVDVKPAYSNNLIWGKHWYSNLGWASALRAGATIRASKKFQASHTIMCLTTHFGSGLFGPWWYAHNRYLGLEFQINGQAHYGWARLNFKSCEFHEVSGTLTGYAYETVPNKSIKTGKTHGPDVITVHDASLGHLARGASAIPAWREK
jgi:hypothetical protein